MHCRYLLVHGSIRKKVEFNLDEGAKVTRKALREKVFAVFDIAETQLQVYDKGFEDWVDLEDDDEVENSKVMVQNNEQNVACSRPKPSVKSSDSLSR